jgi:hypothetical protein
VSRGLLGITRCRDCGREGVLGFERVMSPFGKMQFRCKSRRACEERKAAEEWKVNGGERREEAK